MGDPTGIGPEIVCEACGGANDVVVYGDRAVLARAAAVMRASVPPNVVDLAAPDAAHAQIAYLEAAVADARAGQLDALVTAPIHKASAIAAGFAFPGHTELLQARFGVER